MAFGLPFYAKGGQLYVTCQVNPSTNRTAWMYALPDKSLATTLPECNYLCGKDPIDDPKLYNRTWVTGTITVGTVSNYKCAGKL